MPLRKKFTFFGTILYSKNKVPNAIKLEGGGGLGKALMTLSLRKYIFFSASLIRTSDFLLMGAGHRQLNCLWCRLKGLGLSWRFYDGFVSPTNN